MNKSLIISHIDVILFNKPCNVLCQFTDAENRANLSDYITSQHFYACGRLDRDSEGLLILTNSGKLQHLISNPRFKLQKSYWVQVDGVPDSGVLEELRRGIELKDGMTKPCLIQPIPEPAVSERVPAIRVRKKLPTSWLEISLTEGRNRQIRRMTAAIGFPTLRLIRHRIGPWSGADLSMGEQRQQQVSIDTLPPKWRQYLQDTNCNREQSLSARRSSDRKATRLRRAR